MWGNGSVNLPDEGTLHNGYIYQITTMYTLNIL